MTTLNELIQQLEALKAEHGGDLTVVHDNNDMVCWDAVSSVDVWDAYPNEWGDCFHSEGPSDSKQTVLVIA